MWLEDLALGDVIIKVNPLQLVKPRTTDAACIEYHTSISSAELKDAHAQTHK